MNTLAKKIKALTSSSKAVVRILTEEESSHVESLNSWENGYFITDCGAQIMKYIRENGQIVITCLSH